MKIDRSVVLPTFHAGQLSIWNRRARRNAIRCGRRWGKALALDTPIPTPTGWTTMGALKADDEVFDEQGEICRVTFVTEIMYGRPCNRVVFSDGAEIVADDDHRWMTWDKRARKNSSRNAKNATAGTKKPIINERPAIRTTKEIAETLLDGEERNHSIPCARPLQLPDRDLPIDPYVLGAWLGDGHSASASITCHENDSQIIDEIRSSGQPVKHRGGIDWSLTSGSWKSNSSFRAKLRLAGLLRNKHVPEAYLRASVSQRLALLQGLNDTDGYTNAMGRCEFCSTNQRLAAGYLELALSLGLRAVMFTGRATLNGKDHGEKYRVKFTTNLPVFRLKRKLDALSGRVAKFRMDHRFIDAVVPIASVPVRCITVDSPNSLYLAGRQFIPTHNTKHIVTLASNGAAKGKKVGVFAPERKQLLEPYDDIIDILENVTASSNKSDGFIKTINKGKIDFWNLIDNELAGRGREYDLILVDEAAYTKNGQMLNIWERSIIPTMATRPDADVWVYSTPNGENPDNFFWKICNDPAMGFTEFHSPSGTNPMVSQVWLREEQARLHPDVWRQEILAEFVDWSGVAFFGRDKWLQADGEPMPMPAHCDRVFAVIDSATKTGSTNDGTAVTYYARNQYAGTPLIILDWDIIQIEGALLDTWLVGVFQNLERLSRECGAREGSVGVWIEDKSSGIVLLQQARKRDMNVHAIGGAWGQLGKDERALSVSSYHYQGLCKIAAPAFNKTVVYKGVSRNHLISQVVGFRLGDKDAAKRADDLLDSYVHGLALALGDSEQF